MGNTMQANSPVSPARPGWHSYFMSMAYLAATRSRDESTNIGAVIVTKDNFVVSTGYNSFPSGIKDDVPDRQKRPQKYFYFEHAERNAILLAANNGVRVNGCIMYTQGTPCADCARAIIQSGICKLVTHKDWDTKTKMLETWTENRKAGREMLQEHGVELLAWSGPLCMVPLVPVKVRGKPLKFDSCGFLLGVE